MLNLLFRLQQLEAEERSIAAERINSQEYKQLRAIKAAFDAKKQQYLRLSEDIASLAGELETFPARLAEAERRLAAEQTAIYDGSVSSSKALAARESQAASLAESLSELRSLQAAYEGEQAQKQAVSEQLRREMEEQYLSFRDIKQSYQAAQDIRQQKLDQLTAAKQQIVSRVDGQTLLWFEQQREKFGGSPVACLNQQHICSGCHTMAPPITYKRTLQGQRTYCEKCGRILFVEV